MAPRKFPTAWIVALVLGGALVASCAMAGLMYVLFVHEIREPVQAADLEVLVTAEVLAGFADVEFDPARGKTTHIRHFDRSRELSYEYESPDGAEDPLYISSTVNLERNVSDARTIYLASALGVKIGLGLEGDTMQEVSRPGLLQWGDESRSALLMKGGKPVGNVFAGRKGTTAFDLLIVGVYFEKSEDVQAALGPVLKRLETYRP